jgi:hypothetical protein
VQVVHFHRPEEEEGDEYGELRLPERLDHAELFAIGR